MVDSAQSALNYVGFNSSDPNSKIFRYELKDFQIFIICIKCNRKKQQKDNGLLLEGKTLNWQQNYCTFQFDDGPSICGKLLKISNCQILKQKFYNWNYFYDFPLHSIKNIHAHFSLTIYLGEKPQPTAYNNLANNEIVSHLQTRQQIMWPVCNRKITHCGKHQRP